MGLLADLKVPEVSGARDDDRVLLLHGMMLIIGADGKVEDVEWDLLKSYWYTLPDFKGQIFDEVLEQANQIIARYDDLDASVAALEAIESETLRRKLFVLAADLALCTGAPGAAEDARLGAMQRALRVSDEQARGVLELLALKYAGALVTPE